MWNRKELKEKAKKIIKNNYWNIVIVCVILAILSSDYGLLTPTLFDRNDETLDVTTEGVAQEDLSVSEKMKDYEHLKELDGPVKNIAETTINTLTSSVNSMVKGKKFIYKIVDAIASISNNYIVQGALLLFAAILAILIMFFFVGPLSIGGRRYFIKQRKNKDIPIKELISVYKKDEWIKNAWTIFVRDIYNFLWFFTIVGGPIKYYEYKMIPFLLADNPSMTRKEAFKISKKMMHGNKWKTFVLDLSFVGWIILSLFTFNILSVLFVNPYLTITETELYVSLKENIIKNKEEYHEKLISKEDEKETEKDETEEDKKQTLDK